MGDPTSLKAEKDAERGPNRAQNGHSSAGGAASTGPSALDRRSGTSCSSVPSHRVFRSQPSAPRRHHCQPEAHPGHTGSLSAARAGRLPSLTVAGRRFWPVQEAPDRGRRARQSPRSGALSNASALRPCAAAFRDPGDSTRSAAQNQPSCAFPPTRRRRRLATSSSRHTIVSVGRAPGICIVDATTLEWCSASRREGWTDFSELGRCAASNVVGAESIGDCGVSKRTSKSP
jgi:hypothetical protein